MFDRFMEHTLPLWLTVSAILPLVVAVTLWKAAFRIRQLRALLDEAGSGVGGGGTGRKVDPPAEAMDWAAVPGRDAR